MFALAFAMCTRHLLSSFFFFFNATATTEIYTLSLHDALPISARNTFSISGLPFLSSASAEKANHSTRSEEHTSELQSLTNLVCRLLLEKKKKNKKTNKKENVKTKKIRAHAHDVTVAYIYSH